MRVLFLIDFDTYGGACKMITQLANAVAEKEYFSEVLFYAYCSEKESYPLKESIIFVPGTPYRGNYLVRHFIKLFDAVRVIGNIKPDLIISFLPNPNFVAIKAGKKYHIPTIISERGDPKANKGLYSKLRYSYYRFCDALVCQIPEIAHCFSKTVQKKTYIIPNSISIKKIERIPANKRKKSIAFVGRFWIKQKRQDLMIEVFDRIEKKHEDYILEFYGDGPDEDYIKEMVKKKGLENKVVFHGKCSNLPYAYADAKVYVLTSDFEGIPNSLAEAMAAGIPCVAMNCSPGGANYLIDNEINGILVDRRDVNGTVAAIERLISDDFLADKVGTEAQKVLNKLDPVFVFNKWLSLIDTVIKHDSGE